MFLFRSATNRELDISMFLVRVVTGVVMAVHGYQKVFVMGIGQITGFFGSAGVPLPTVVAPFISILELVGGIALVVGLATRAFALLLAIDMFCAAALVHLRNGFLLPNGAEFVLLLMVLYAAVFIAGGGALSIDARLAADKNASVR